MRALRLPLGTWQRARRWLATDPTQTCWAGGAPGAPRRNAGGTPASEGTGSRTTWVCLCPAAGPSGTVSGGRELRVESLAGGARAMGPGRIPLSCEPREEGERREKEKERDGGTEHEAAWRRPGARGPGFLLERHFPDHPCQLPRQNQSRVQSVHSPRLHGQTINAPQSRPPQLSLSQVTPSPRGQQDVPFTLAPLWGPASEHLPLPPKPLRAWVVRPWALSAPPSQCSGHTGLSPPCAQVHSLPPRPVSVQHTGIRTSAQ